MIVLKTEKEIVAIRKSSRIVAKVLADLRNMIEPGVTTKDLDAFAEKKSQRDGRDSGF